MAFRGGLPTRQRLQDCAILESRDVPTFLGKSGWIDAHWASEGWCRYIFYISKDLWVDARPL